MPRHLDNKFINDLLTGSLKCLLEYVKKDNTLDLQIRGNYINIYYRGGNALKVIKMNGLYKYYFDVKYVDKAKLSFASEIEIQKNTTNWNLYFPLAKQAMDFYITGHSKEEREFQQLVVRENNYSTIANSTDYFIIDIEYDNHKNARFDLVAVEWPSKGSLRKLSKNYKPKLFIFEMKYGDAALSGTAGIKKHVMDFNTFISGTAEVSDFKSEMLDVLNQKRLLGMIPKLSDEHNMHQILEFDESVELIFLLSNHDPDSTKLNTELSLMANENIHFITSNFSGYGLYMENVFTLDEFKARFSKQIGKA